jgi:hypothetical protein
MRGLIIKEPYIDNILSGKKDWEIRGSNTNIREKIALIKSGSGKIFGTVDLVGCRELSLEDYISNGKKHGFNSSGRTQLPYKKTFAWFLENPILLENPIPYTHPMGAVIWVKLDSKTSKLINFK